MGCNDENSCNECSECDLFSKSCEPKDDAPCWCEEVGCDECRKCDINAESGTFGACVAVAPGTCSTCTHIDSYECPCGETVGPITVCSKYDPVNGSGYGGNIILGNKSALQVAQEQCRPASSCDPCKGDCVTKTYCSDTTGPPPACPPGFICTVLGTLSAGGVDCTFREECDMSDVPEDCKDCDCNCHDDCPDCEICAADGTCQPDPTCEVCSEGQKLCSDLETCCGEEEQCYTIYENIFQTGPDNFSAIETVGPIDWAIVSPGGDCGSFDCNGNQTPYPSFARNRMAVYNVNTPGFNGCSGGLQCYFYRDPQCNWDGGPFDPVLISSEKTGTGCCTPNLEP